MPDDKNAADRDSTSSLVISDDHRLAIEGWKSRKEQLYRQQKSVLEINDEAEKVNLLSLSQQQQQQKKDDGGGSVGSNNDDNNDNDNNNNCSH